MASARPAFTLLGDVIASRQAKDRLRLQKNLDAVLALINDVLSPVVPLEPTIGDEFQASFKSVATAVKASLLLRLALLADAEVDSRYGLGIGPVQVVDTQRRMSQDGPGWWAARGAIEEAKRMSHESHTGFVRTSLSADSPGWKREEAALSSHLLCRDAMVDRMRPVARNRLYGLMLGLSQADIAAREGTTQSAVSQSLARSGDTFAILIAQDRLDKGYL
jgi:hypothetical protein